MSQRLKQGTIVFDIIGTSFSLEVVGQALSKIGAPAHALPLWFAQSLRDGFALSHAGGYQPLRSLLEAELPRTLKQLGISAGLAQVKEVVAAFGRLEPQPGFSELVKDLAADGWKILALTNSSVESTRGLLDRAGVVKHFSALLSTDQVQTLKPHPKVYELAKNASAGETWMVAAHAWDIQGAARAGLRTVFISGLEKEYLSVYPSPDVTVASLAEVRDALERAIVGA